MTRRAGQAEKGRETPGEPAHVRLRRRCAEAGVATWRHSASGMLIDRPLDETPAALASPTVARLVDRTVRSWVGDESPGVREIAPSLWAAPLVEVHRRRRRAITVALLAGRDFPETETGRAAVRDACGGSDDGAAAAEMRDALNAVCTHDEGSARALAQSLEWMQRDLLEIDEAAASLDQFSTQLAESYEEISLLYRLGTSMNQIEHPQRFVKQVCEELTSIMAYGWIAAVFGDDSRTTRVLSGEVISATQPEVEKTVPKRLAQLLLVERWATSELDPGDGGIVPGPQAHGLVDEESHVLAQPIRARGEVVGVLLAGDKSGEDAAASAVDMKLLEAAAGYAGVVVENAALYEEQHATFLGTIEACTAAIDAKDPYTRGHSQRVAYLAQQLALRAGLSEASAERIRVSGLVHDIGKIGVPEAVLCKAGRLTDEEYALIRKHPEIGHHILRDIPMLDDVLPGVMHHHERYDGRGYPHGLSGEDIPLVARIMGIADAFDAMSSNRTYRAAMTRERVLAEIRNGRGTQFDPRLADLFLTCDLTQYDAMVAQHHAEETQRGRAEAA